MTKTLTSEAREGEGGKAGGRARERGGGGEGKKEQRYNPKDIDI